MNECEAFVALNMIEGIGPITVMALLDEYGSALNVLNEKPDRLELFSQSTPASGPIAKIRNWEKKIDLSGEMKRIESMGVDILHLNSDRYPSLLKQINDPPIVLYVLGDPGLENGLGVSIVGSRKTTDYGVEIAGRIGSSLGHRQVTVVSGGARGIDTAAHWACLNAGGKTVCVFGNGINRVYPAENRELFQQIAGSGAVMTQFPFNRRGDRQTFPMRNRIVAGLTIGTIIVEAPAASGAMITARMALDYNREVYAVPGRFGEETSAGCHQLIRDGAVLLDSLDPLYEDLNRLFPGQNRHPTPEITELQHDTATPRLDQFAPKEQAVLQSIIDGFTQLDDIIRQSKLPPSVVQVTLLKLEVAKVVTSNPGKHFSLPLQPTPNSQSPHPE